MQKRLLYQGVKVSRKPPVNYEELAGDRAFIELEEYIEPTYLCEISNVFVSPYGIAFKNGRVIPESVYSMFTGNKNALTFFKKIAMGKFRRVSGDCLVAHNAYYDNYYHWTLEALPRIYSMREYTKGLTLLIHEKTKPYIEEYLRYFEFKDIVKVKDDELVLAQNLWLPTHTAKGLRHNEPLVREMASYLKSKTPGSGTGHEKIFISRKRAAYRRAKNEDEVFGFFREHGFSGVTLEDLSLAEQIHLFRNAKALSGIHGAGFSNLIYMDQGEHLIDIIHEQHPQNAFFTLAAAFGLDYSRIECKGVDDRKYAGNDDLVVEIGKIKSCLKSSTPNQSIEV